MSTTVLGLLRRGDVSAAVSAYGGDLLPGTNSPALTELADYVAVALREALLADPQPDAVLTTASSRPTTPRSSRPACTGPGLATTPPRPCSEAASQRPAASRAGPARTGGPGSTSSRTAIPA